MQKYNAPDLPKDATKFQRMMALFEVLSTLPDSDRKDYLESHCPDKETRVRLVQMLANLEETQCFLDDSILDTLRFSPEEIAADWVGRQLDDFTITEVIGEGGMGVVFKATQNEPVHREVAIKMVHSGAPSEYTARFRLEQASLAKLNHPNIATIYSVGETDFHQPYIAMEYIVGEQLLDYCRNQQLDLRTKLDLFVQVCKGISFSHQRGVLHRDIKPANILVRTLETGPIAKVIDFGIASDIDNDRKEKHLMGTFEFMSPEHLNDAANMDVRTDIYSLGMLLLSIVLTKPKFNRNQMTGQTLEAIKSWLDYCKPESISGYAKTLDPQTKSKLAEESGLTPTKWQRQYTEELDWIYQKATAKDPNERYNTCQELAEEVQRYLNNYPLRTAPKSQRYRIKKYVQRNPLFSGSAALMLTLLIGFSINTSIQNKKITAQYLRAEAASAQAVAAQKLAEEEQEIAEQTSELMANMFSSLDHNVNSTEPKTPLEVLERSYEDILEKDEIKPRVRYRFMLELAMLFMAFEQVQKARNILNTVINRTDTPNAILDILANTRMAYTFHNASIGNEIELAYGYARTAYQIIQENTVPLTYRHEVISSLALSSQMLGKRDSLEKYAKEIWEINIRLHGNDSIETAYARNHYAFALYFNQKFVEAENMFNEALLDYKVLFKNDDDVVIQAKNYLTYLWTATEKNTEQNFKYIEEVRQSVKEKFGEISTNYLVILHAQASAFMSIGRFEDAIDVYEDYLRIVQTSKLTKDEMHHISLEFMARSYLGLGRYDEATNWLERWFTEASHYPELRQSNYLWIELLMRQGRMEEALAHKQLLLSEMASGKYNHHSLIFLCYVTLTLLAVENGDLSEAESMLQISARRLSIHVDNKLSRELLIEALSSYLTFKNQPTASNMSTFEKHLDAYKASEYAYSFYVEKLTEYAEGINSAEVSHSSN